MGATASATTTTTTTTSTSPSSPNDHHHNHRTSKSSTPSTHNRRLSHHSTAELRRMDEEREQVNREIFELQEDLQPDAADYVGFTSVVCKKLLHLEELALRLENVAPPQSNDDDQNDNNENAAAAAAAVDQDGDGTNNDTEMQACRQELDELMALIRQQNEVARRRISLEKLLEKRYDDAIRELSLLQPPPVSSPSGNNEL